VLLLTLFGGFYSHIAPPDDDLKFWPSYGSLLASLTFLVCNSFGKTTRRIVFGVSVFFAVLLPVYYFAKYQDLIGEFGGSKVICGTEYTARGREFSVRHPDISKDDLLFHFAGKAKDVWTEESVNGVRLLLGLIYSGGLAFLALTLLTGLQESKQAPGVQSTSASEISHRGDVR
jgi:hypothetical protein